MDAPPPFSCAPPSLMENKNKKERLLRKKMGPTQKRHLAHRKLF